MAIAISAAFASALILYGLLLAVDFRGLAGWTARYGKRMRDLYGPFSPGYTDRESFRQMGVAMVFVGLLLLGMIVVLMT